METKYVTENQFNKLSKGKLVKSYPNRYIKDIEGIEYNIIPNCEKFETKVLSPEEKVWLCGVQTEEEVVELCVTERGWFPTDLIAGTLPKHLGCGIIREGFNMNTELSKKTGWLHSTDNCGSRSALFLKSKVNEAINILNKNGFNFKGVEQ